MCHKKNENTEAQIARGARGRSSLSHVVEAFRARPSGHITQLEASANPDSTGCLQGRQAGVRSCSISQPLWGRRCKRELGVVALGKL